jgi:hypothetical protein
MSIRDKTAAELADLIERYLSNRCTYPQEWNDFVDCSNRDPKLDAFRRQCEIISSQFETDQKSLDPNRYDRRQDATDELKKIAAQLRDLEREAKT